MNIRFSSPSIKNTTTAFILASTVLLAPVSVLGQSTSVRSQIAELNQRFTELEHNYNLLKLEVSNLNAENNRLKQEISILKQTGNSEEVEEVLNAKIEAHRKSTENYVKTQFERIMTLLPGENEQPQAATFSQPVVNNTQQTQIVFSNDFPKDGELYVVQSGDTLSKIAKKFGSSVSYIQSANQILDPNTVRVGQKLFVPIKR